ncbi:MAG: diiron oxygenase [Alphaproteobacteria bacterium]|nr:diiron oxygenase [Alphaproteobacteria bacterium]
MSPSHEEVFEDPAAVSAQPSRSIYGKELESRYLSMGPKGRYVPMVGHGRDADDPGAWWSQEKSMLLMHPEVQQAPEEVQQRVLAGECMAYNHFTSQLERGPVSWVCETIGHGELLPALPRMMRMEGMVMLVEEKHHDLCSMDVLNRVSQDAHVLCPGVAPAFEHRLMDLMAEEGEEHAWLVVLAFVIGSETLITSMLSDMATDKTLKELVRDVMRDHAMDELKHRAFFNKLVVLLARYLSLPFRDRLARILPLTLAAYLEPDRVMLEAVARNAGLADPEGVAFEVSVLPEVRQSMKLAAAPSVRTFRRLGLLERPGVEELYVAHGLV